jgi:predicted membrane protein
VGYAIAAVVNAALVYAVNVWPGWQTLPFLNQDTSHVLGLVNLSLVAGLVANLVYLANDAPWLRSLGELVTTGIGLAALVRFWQVFPFDFGGSSFEWALLARFVLVVAIVGSVLGVFVQFVLLMRRLLGGTEQQHPAEGRSAR